MKRIAALVAPLCLLILPRPAEAQQIGCFSDGDFVYLHVGITYQYYLDRGERPVDCTPDAVLLGLELTEEAVQTFCADGASALCEEKQQNAALIRETYGDMLPAAGTAAGSPPEPAGQAAAAAPATPATQDEPEASAGQAAAAPAPEVRLDSRETILWVQESLRELGYNPGPLDGAMGRRTRAAIQRYERDNDIPVTGRMSAALVASLRQRIGQ